MTEVTYYLMVGRHNLARVRDTFAYERLDQESGKWVASSIAFDQILFDPAVTKVTLAQARKWVETVMPTLEPEWLDGMDT